MSDCTKRRSVGFLFSKIPETKVLDVVVDKKGMQSFRLLVISKDGGCIILDKGQPKTTFRVHPFSIESVIEDLTFDCL